MINKSDLMTVLVALEDRGLDINQPMRKLVTAKEIPTEVLKFILDNKGIEVANFYEMLRKKHNEKKSPLYHNIVKDIEDIDIYIEKLNEVGGANGIGIADIVENRLVGMKSRGVYETPGGTILYYAHQVLETLCLDKETQHYKQQVALKFADLVYNGQWFTPLREALSAFVDSTQQNVTGDVKLKLYKGNMINAGVTSPYSLYNEEIATFAEDDCYDQMDSKGFINLFGLPIKVKALMEQKNKNK